MLLLSNAMHGERTVARVCKCIDHVRVALEAHSARQPAHARFVADARRTQADSIGVHMCIMMISGERVVSRCPPPTDANMTIRSGVFVLRAKCAASLNCR